MIVGTSPRLLIGRGKKTGRLDSTVVDIVTSPSVSWSGTPGYSVLDVTEVVEIKWSQ